MRTETTTKALSEDICIITKSIKIKSQPTKNDLRLQLQEKINNLLSGFIVSNSSQRMNNDAKTNINGNNDIVSFVDTLVSIVRVRSDSDTQHQIE